MKTIKTIILSILAVVILAGVAVCAGRGITGTWDMREWVKLPDTEQTTPENPDTEQTTPENPDKETNDKDSDKDKDNDDDKTDKLLTYKSVVLNCGGYVPSASDTVLTDAYPAPDDSWYSCPAFSVTDTGTTFYGVYKFQLSASPSGDGLELYVTAYHSTNFSEFMNSRSYVMAVTDTNGNIVEFIPKSNITYSLDGGDKLVFVASTTVRNNFSSQEEIRLSFFFIPDGSTADFAGWYVNEARTQIFENITSSPVYATFIDKSNEEI